MKAGRGGWKGEGFVRGEWERFMLGWRGCWGGIDDA